MVEHYLCPELNRRAEISFDWSKPVRTLGSPRIVSTAVKITCDLWDMGLCPVDGDCGIIADISKREA